MVVEVCREFIGNACRPPPLTTTRRRSNICDLVSRRTDTATWFGLVCWVKRNGDDRRCAAGGEEVELKYEKKKIRFIVIIIYYGRWFSGWPAGGASGFVLSRESVLLCTAQHIGTRQQSPKTRRVTGETELVWPLQQYRFLYIIIIVVASD